MGLQRWHVARGGLDLTDCLDERGEWVRWADVDALLTRIRAAVEAERDAPGYVRFTDMGRLPVLRQARAALDALLIQGVTDE